MAHACRYTLPSGRSGFVTKAHTDAFREAAYAGQAGCPAQPCTALCGCVLLGPPPLPPPKCCCSVQCLGYCCWRKARSRAPLCPYPPPARCPAAANITYGGPAWSAGLAPPVITYLMAMNHEPVVNNGEVLGALRDVGRALGLSVRPYSVTPGAAFPSFVASMANTGVLVARHGPLLANAMFLPPGAVVLELLPYNWEWRGISEIYVNLTRSVGAVHHFAWKANSSEVGGICGAREGGRQRAARSDVRFGLALAAEHA